MSRTVVIKDNIHRATVPNCRRELRTKAMQNQNTLLDKDKNIHIFETVFSFKLYTVPFLGLVCNYF